MFNNIYIVNILLLTLGLREYTSYRR